MHVGVDLDDRPSAQNHDRIAGVRARHQVTVAIVVDVCRDRRQRRAERTQPADAGKIPRADALRVGGGNTASRATKYVDGAMAFVRRADRQICSTQDAQLSRWKARHASVQLRTTAMP